VKKETTSPIVEDILKQMKFVEEHALNYDPKGIIAHRRSQLDRGKFMHCTIPDLTK